VRLSCTKTPILSTPRRRGWRFASGALPSAGGLPLARRANDFGTLPNGLKGHEHGMEDVGEILG